MATSIVNTLMDAQKDQLTTELITNVTDTTKAGRVQTGLLREDPLDSRISLMVQQGNEDWKHVLNVKAPESLYDQPVYEIGGSGRISWWRRRFITDIKIFLEGYSDEEEARIIANIVLSRAEWALRTMTMPSGPDTFGESAHTLNVFDSYITQSGGEDTHIYRGEIRTEVVTSITNA